MNVETLDFKYNAPFDNLQLINSPIVLKGPTLVNFSLSGVTESDFNVDEIIINWGDGTPSEVHKRAVIFDYRTQSILNEVLYGKTKGSVLRSYSHAYNNQFNTYEVDYTAEIILHKSNGQYLYVKQPINTFWSSFYDNIERLSIVNTHLLPSEANYAFVNFEGSKEKNVYASTLKDTGTPLLTASNATNITRIGNTSVGSIAGDLVYSFWATTDGTDIEITTSTSSYLVDITPGVMMF